MKKNNLHVQNESKSDWHLENARNGFMGENTGIISGFIWPGSDDSSPVEQDRKEKDAETFKNGFQDFYRECSPVKQLYQGKFD